MLKLLVLVIFGGDDVADDADDGDENGSGDCRRWRIKGSIVLFCGLSSCHLWVIVVLVVMILMMMRVMMVVDTVAVHG